MAMEHREPDRVPFDCSFTVGAYDNICRYFGLQFMPRKEMNPYLTIHPDLEIIGKLDLDLAYIEPGRPSSKKDILLTKVVDYIDEWGLLWHRIDHGSGFYFEVKNCPLKDATVEDLDEYPWPNPMDEGIYENLQERVSYLRKNSDLAIVGKFGAAFFATAGYLRGVENLYVDLLLNPELVRKLLAKISDYYTKLYERAIEKIGGYLDIIRVDNDDFGSQEAPLISVSMYRDFFKGIHFGLNSRIKDCLKKIARKCFIMKHSCGSVSSFIGEFLETGIDILNPIQPKAAGMDQVTLKRKYGSTLSFHGGIDTQHVLARGSEKDIEDEVKRCISAMSRNGGYICAPAHHIQDDVPPENIIHLRDSVLKWGKYPIEIGESR
jgi:uroporphyrinogen decarboxylase